MSCSAVAHEQHLCGELAPPTVSLCGQHLIVIQLKFREDILISVGL